MMRKHPWVLWVSSSRLRGEVVALAVTAYYLVHGWLDQVSLRFEKCECEKLSQNTYGRCAPKFGMIGLENNTCDRRTGNGIPGVVVIDAGTLPRHYDQHVVNGRRTEIAIEKTQNVKVTIGKHAMEIKNDGVPNRRVQCTIYGYEPW